MDEYGSKEYFSCYIFYGIFDLVYYSHYWDRNLERLVRFSDNGSLFNIFFLFSQIILSTYVIRRGSSERIKWLCTSMFAALPVLLWLPCLHQQMSFVSTLHQEYTAYPVEKVIGGNLIVTIMDQFLHHSAWRPWYKFLINHVSWKDFPCFSFFSRPVRAMEV